MLIAWSSVISLRELQKSVFFWILWLILLPFCKLCFKFDPACTHLAYLRMAWGMERRATILEQIWLGNKDRSVIAPPLTNSKKHGKCAYTTEWCNGQPGTQVHICSKGSGSAPYCRRSYREKKYMSLNYNSTSNDCEWWIWYYTYVCCKYKMCQSVFSVMVLVILS